MLHQLGLKMELITGITLTKWLVRTTQKQTVSMETQIFNAKMIQIMRHLSLNMIQLQLVLANIQKYKFQKEQKRRILNTCGTKWDGIRPETEIDVRLWYAPRRYPNTWTKCRWDP